MRMQVAALMQSSPSSHAATNGIMISSAANVAQQTTLVAAHDTHISAHAVIARSLADATPAIVVHAPALGGPRSLYRRVATYSSNPITPRRMRGQGAAQFDMMERHRDSPAHFVGAREYLWSAPQRRELTSMFGTSGRDLSLAILRLAGAVRRVRVNSATTTTDASVGAAAHIRQSRCC